MPQTKYYLDKDGLRSLIANILSPSTYVAVLNFTHNATITDTSNKGEMEVTYYRGVEQKPTTFEKFYANRFNAIVVAPLQYDRASRGIYQVCRLDNEWIHDELPSADQDRPYHNKDGCLFTPASDDVNSGLEGRVYLNTWLNKDDELVYSWAVEETIVGLRTVQLTQATDANNNLIPDTYTAKYYIGDTEVLWDEFDIDNHPEDVTVIYTPPLALGAATGSEYYKLVGTGTSSVSGQRRKHYNFNKITVNDDNSTGVEVYATVNVSTGDVTWGRETHELTVGSVELNDITTSLDYAEIGDLVLWDKTKLCKTLIRKDDLTDEVASAVTAQNSNLLPIGVIAIPSSENVYGNGQAMMVSVYFADINCNGVTPGISGPGAYAYGQYGEYSQVGNFEAIAQVMTDLKTSHPAVQVFDTTNPPIHNGELSDNVMTVGDVSNTISDSGEVYIQISSSPDRSYVTEFPELNGYFGDELKSADVGGYGERNVDACAWGSINDNPLVKSNFFKDATGNLTYQFNGYEMTNYLWEYMSETQKTYVSRDLAQQNSYTDTPTFWPVYITHWYRTLGTNYGDWYVGSIGELAYVIQHYPELFNTLSKLGYGAIINCYNQGHTASYSIGERAIHVCSPIAAPVVIAEEMMTEGNSTEMARSNGAFIRISDTQGGTGHAFTWPFCRV